MRVLRPPAPRPARLPGAPAGVRAGPRRPHLRAAVAIAQGLVGVPARQRRRPRGGQPARPRALDRAGRQADRDARSASTPRSRSTTRRLARHPGLEAMRDLDEEDPIDVEARAAGPQLHPARRRHRLHGQRRRAGDDHDGPGQARRRRAGQLPRHRRRRTVRQGRRGDAASSWPIPSVRAILVNIFGGIARGDEVARGLVEARAQQNREVPMVVRIVGTNAAQAAEILRRPARASRQRPAWTRRSRRPSPRRAAAAR